ncbi:MAG: phosphoribosylamine--glycine ligase, partial [Bacillota bacterium]
LAECVEIAADDVEKLLAFAREEGINLTVVGPEAPLMAGIVDAFRAEGLRIFGPTRAAAELEGSKALAKDLMAKYNIPTAAYRVFTEAEPAKAFIRQLGAPCVVKADGLAAGKGVIVARTLAEAEAAVDLIMGERAFGSAGDRVVVEEYLEGQEVSILAFTDGRTVIPMVSAQDHKRIFDGDQGPNTGGMGAYSPAPIYTPEVAAVVEREILLPTIQGMAADGRPYQGVLYAGLMLTKDGPKVLEYNARFGDPETQAVLPRLETDLVEIMEAVIDGRLDEIQIQWKPEAAVCVVMAAEGYPGPITKGDEIQGLAEAEAAGALVFHAGTRAEGERILTAGGRVLGVTALGANIEEAIQKAYQGVECISFRGMQYRRDIGAKALR